MLDFEDTAGSACGSLLPTGSAVDVIDGVPVTCLDNGMPVVVFAAAAVGVGVGVTGYESPAELEADEALRALLEQIRLKAGELMKLGDVSATSVPKLTLVAPARDGGTISTRTFIPHRCHASIGVLARSRWRPPALLPGRPLTSWRNRPRVRGSGCNTRPGSSRSSSSSTNPGR